MLNTWSSPKISRQRWPTLISSTLHVNAPFRAEYSRQLTSSLTHVGCPRITDMRIVRPDYNFRVPGAVLTSQIAGDGSQRPREVVVSTKQVRVKRSGRCLPRLTKATTYRTDHGR